MASNSNHCSFVLLAEFDIFEGAALKYQFPQPLGIDEVLLAMLMLPDGAETHLDDWTIFFLNQTPFNTISPVLALETGEAADGARRQSGYGGDSPELLCVLNLVRTKHDKTLERGARVRAMAICTRHPFIQIFKPVLLMAMDHYFSDPSQDCLARLFDSVNAMDLSGAPTLTRDEKLVMRASERKDIFVERFAQQAQQRKASSDEVQRGQTHHANVPSWDGTKEADTVKAAHKKVTSSDFDEDIMLRNPDVIKRDRAFTESVGTARAPISTHGRTASHHALQMERQKSSPPSDMSFTLGGSAVWVGDESGLESNGSGGSTTSLVGTGVASTVGSTTLVDGATRDRASTDASVSSTSSQGHPRLPATIVTPSQDIANQSRPGATTDTHFYNTSLLYKGHRLPIRMPLSTFPEEVGDYTLIPLIKTFSQYQLVSGPVHPHLHTNGAQTHPIIILFNALVTGKRLIFMGHKKPAGQVSSYVLSACALGSGCGVVLRGFIERAFPYANLNNKEEWESVPGYIAGVTNLIFQSTGSWDVLFDIASGQVMVHKDIHARCPPTPGPGLRGPPLMVRTGTLKAESSLGSDELNGKVGGTRDGPGAKEFVPKGDNADSLFIEDIRMAIEFHFGEGMVRQRFTEYVIRFVRLAARYETEVYGVTKIGYPHTPFAPGQLGSGVVFIDDITCQRELAANANRIEGWRRTNVYQHYIADFSKLRVNDAIKGFDLPHQVFRLRHAKYMPDSEVELILRTISDNLQSYEQVVQLLSHLTPSGGGLMHIGFGLFHQVEAIRELTVDIFNQLRLYPVGVLFLQALNHFQRYAYVRQAHDKEKRYLGSVGGSEPNLFPPPPPASRTSSQRGD